MMKTEAAVVSFIKGANIRPEANLDMVQSEIPWGEKSYYAYQKVFSTLAVEDIPKSDLPTNNKIFMEELK